jgi:hypothetical protein
VRKSWKVLDLGGDGQLPSGLRAFHTKGRKVGASGINRCGQACRTGSQDDNILDSITHGANPLKDLFFLLGDLVEADDCRILGIIGKLVDEGLHFLVGDHIAHEVLLEHADVELLLINGFVE